MDAYQIVQKARDVHRLSTKEIIAKLCSEFIELHGDKANGDDAAMIGGVGLIDNSLPITIIGLQKGLDTKENIERNFGSAGPSGYRKAQRLMEQAEKFNRPVLTLINTAGADASPESEEHGIGEAIAHTLTVMAELSVPTLAIILGEGGSGGAIALALADRVWMMENAIYSILSPEAFASIIWKDSRLAPEAAETMKLTAKELYELGVIERIIPESDANHQAYSKDVLADQVSAAIIAEFKNLMAMPVKDRLEARQARFRKF